jgi:hypothetical protein
MTNSMHVIIAAENDPNRAIADEVERRLLEPLRQNVPASDGKELTLVARDLQGVMIGGLIGSTSYGCFL